MFRNWKLVIRAHPITSWHAKRNGFWLKMCYHFSVYHRGYTEKFYHIFISKPYLLSLPMGYWMGSKIQGARSERTLCGTRATSNDEDKPPASRPSGTFKWSHFLLHSSLAYPEDTTSSSFIETDSIWTFYGFEIKVMRYLDQNGKYRSLAEYQGTWILLYFYPKDNTAGCTKQACMLRAHQLTPLPPAIFKFWLQMRYNSSAYTLYKPQNSITFSLRI